MIWNILDFTRQQSIHFQYIIESGYPECNTRNSYYSVLDSELYSLILRQNLGPMQRVCQQTLSDQPQGYLYFIYGTPMIL